MERALEVAMPTPTEHKTVQSRILAYAQEIGWTYVSRDEAERRRGKETGLSSPGEVEEDTGWKTHAPLSLYFGDLLQARQITTLYSSPAAL